MYNLFDYLEWRGDLPFSAVDFCAADAVILSRLSCIPFDGVVNAGFEKTITISQAADRIFSGEPTSFLWSGDERLLRELSACERYRGLPLCGFVNEVDNDRQMQFSAITIDLGIARFVSYRGTDRSLVGWQEDFNLFFTFPVASQLEAQAYFEQVSARFQGSFYLGGHSKGGNLAVYAAAFSSPEVQKRILGIYNMDGPGFEHENMQNSGFARIIHKIHTYVPQSSIFGMLFEHEEGYTVIRSNQRGFFQHDVYTWEIDRDRPATLRRQTGTCAFFDHTLTQFVDQMTIEERRELTEAIFNIMKSTEEDTFDDMADKLLRDITTMLKSFTRLDADTRSMILMRLGNFLKAAGSNFADLNPLTKENREIRREHKPKRYKRKKKSRV